MSAGPAGGVRPVAVPRPISRVRAVLVFAGLLALAAMITVRLFEVQVVRHDEFADRARRQYRNRRDIEPERGMILDRRGTPLVSNLPDFWSVGVRPREVTDPDRLAKQLSDVLGLSVSTLRAKLGSGRSFVWLRRKLPKRVAQQAKVLGGEVVELRRETRRSYPYGPVGGQVIGFVDVDDVGRSGIEGYYEEVLAGRPGWEVLQHDAKRREILDPEFPRKPPLNGGRVVLSLDINAQAIAEEELQRAVDTYDAAGGMIVVTRPYTGEILAIASSPRYDPNQPGAYDAGARKNRAITDAFEPGSTFKVVPFSGLFDRDLVDIDEPVNCERGSWHIADRIIHDAHPYNILTAQLVLAKSSNIGTAKLAQRLTKREFYTLMRDFGFGQKTGIPLPGEIRGFLEPPSEWSGVSQANLAMGHGVAVTALQLAMAYGVLANDGLLLKPILVLSVTRPDGEVELARPQVVRRVLRPGTARDLRRLLSEAVEVGTGKAAHIPGFTVAGKTGTAQKVDLEKHTYYQDRFVSSFAGFVPAERPELLAVVVIDDPRDGIYYGGTVAAPVFRRVLQRLLVTLPRDEPPLPGEPDRQPEVYPVREETGRVVVPSLVSLTPSEVEESLSRLGLQPVWQGRGSVVAAQGTPPGTAASRGSLIEVVLEEPATSANGVKVPDLRGMDLRQAVATLSRLGLRAHIEGEGIVIRQSPPPGSAMRIGRVCSITARNSPRGSS